MFSDTERNNLSDTLKEITDKEIIDKYIKEFFLVSPGEGVPRRGMAKHGKPNFTTWKEILEALYYTDNINDAAIRLHYGTTRASSNEDAPKKGMEGSLHKMHPGWPIQLGKDNAKAWRTHIQNSVGYNTCIICKELLPLDKFDELHSPKYTSRVYRNECIICHGFKQRNWTKEYKKKNPGVVNASSAKRRAAKLNKTPKWAKIDEIKEFYKNCPEGYHVDHIIPLLGKLVSGLHVLENLQYLPAKENLKKSNSFDLEKFNS